VFAFSAHSEALLATVKPELAAVARAALARSTVDFGIVQGNRTPDEQQRLYGQGRSAAQCAAAGVPVEYAQPGKPEVTWTLKSNHIGGNAIDVCPFVDGSPQWDNDGHLGLWPAIATAFDAAAQAQGITIYWGGRWAGRSDRPHFSLVAG